MIKLGAKELRTIEPTPEDFKKIKRNPIYIVLDNVLDTYNVGAIFRLADAVAAERIFLCGETATPEDPKVGHKIEKASVGTWRWVEWEYCPTAEKVVKKLQNSKDQKLQNSKTPMFKTGKTPKIKNSKLANIQNSRLARSKDQNLEKKIQIVAIEQDPRSVPYTKAEYQLPLCLVVGNETYGVSKEVLDISDLIVEIPMFGVNKSLNVMVSLAIVVYKVMEGGGKS